MKTTKRNFCTRNKLCCYFSMFLRVWHKFWYGFSSSQIDGCSQQITYFPLRKWYLRPPFPQFRWWKTCQRFSTNVCYSCSSAFSCWKICWVCVHMVIFSMSHIKTYKNTSNIFGHFSKKTCRLTNWNKPNIESGDRLRKRAIFTLRKWILPVSLRVGHNQS